MKNLFLFIILLAWTFAGAQVVKPTVHAEGVARIVSSYQPYTTIVFKKSGKSQVVNYDPAFEVGKEYNFWISEVTFKGSKVTAKVHDYYKDSSQNVRDRRQKLDTFPNGINLKLKWY